MVWGRAEGYPAAPAVQYTAPSHYQRPQLARRWPSLPLMPGSRGGRPSMACCLACSAHNSRTARRRFVHYCTSCSLAGGRPPGERGDCCAGCWLPHRRHHAARLQAGRLPGDGRGGAQQAPMIVDHTLRWQHSASAAAALDTHLAVGALASVRQPAPRYPAQFCVLTLATLGTAQAGGGEGRLPLAAAGQTHARHVGRRSGGRGRRCARNAFPDYF